MDYKEQNFVSRTKNNGGLGALKSKLDNSIGFEFPIAENPRVSKMIEKKKLAQTYCRLKRTWKDTGSGGQADVFCLLGWMKFDQY